ncbi:hypothetical protein V6N13_146082 [Hibiscus sabdariffa]
MQRLVLLPMNIQNFSSRNLKVSGSVVLDSQLEFSIIVIKNLTSYCLSLKGNSCWHDKPRYFSMDVWTKPHLCYKYREILLNQDEGDEVSEVLMSGLGFDVSFLFSDDFLLSRRKTWRLDKAGSISMDVKTKPERFYDAGDGSFMVNSHVYTNKASL